MAVVVDDALLLGVLAGAAPVEVQGTVYTTGLWNFRLGQALHPGASTEALARRLNQLAPERQRRVLPLVDELPPSIGLLSMRLLVPVIRQLDPAARLNLLAAEALATAYIVGASVLVATDAPLLRRACEAAEIEYSVTA